MSQLAPEIPEPARRRATARVGAGPDGRPSRVPLPRRPVGVPPRPSHGAGVRRAGRRRCRCAVARRPAAVRRDDRPRGGVRLVRRDVPRPRVEDERHFERLLWSQLEQLHEVDEQPGTSRCRPTPRPALRLQRRRHRVLHRRPAPQASRDARRTPTPTLVFNLHEQFEELRASGRFPRMRDKIRERDLHLQGTVNPMVADHGEDSEARQYSGRQVGPALAGAVLPERAGAP